MKFLEYARRRQQGYGPARSLHLANESYRVVDTVVVGLILFFAVYLLVEAIDIFL